MKKILRIYILVLVLTFSITTPLPVKVSAKPDLPVHNVDTGLDYATIKEAIDANETLDGHTIQVDAGIYNRIVVDKSLRILGESMTNTTIVGWSFNIVSIVAENVTISGFTITEPEDASPSDAKGIRVKPGSRNNRISNNNITCGAFAVGYGIYLEETSNNTISENIIKSFNPIGLYSADQNIFNENTIIHGRRVFLNSSSSNVFNANTMLNEDITMLYSHNNILRGNVVNSSGVGFIVSGISINHYVHDIDASNMINGKPIYYWVNTRNRQVPEDAGFVALVSSTNITVEDISLRNSGILLINTTNSKIENVNITSFGFCIDIFESRNNLIRNSVISSPERQGDMGIRMRNSNYNKIINNRLVNVSQSLVNIEMLNSSYNSLVDNLISDSQYGVLVWSSSNHNIISRNEISYNRDPLSLIDSHGNAIYHNSFIENAHKAKVSYNSTNIWDNGYPSGGNYWSDYNGTDLNNGPYQNETGSDGIGDSPYIINEENKDNYPLIGTFSDFNITREEKTHHVTTICNSTISNFDFGDFTNLETGESWKAIRFQVTGPDDTIGFCRICIPTALMNSTYTVFVSFTEVPHTLLPCSNSTHSYLYFTYNHSRKEVIIIPEIPSTLIMPLLMISTFVAIVLSKKKRHSKDKQHMASLRG